MENTERKQDEVELICERGGLDGLQELEVNLILESTREEAELAWKRELDEALRRCISTKGILGTGR